MENKIIKGGRGREGSGWERGWEGEIGNRIKDGFWGIGENPRGPGNMQPHVVGGGRTLWKVPEIQEVRDSQDSIWVTLAKMPNSGER
jgi:hypothetical protein